MEMLQAAKIDMEEIRKQLEMMKAPEREEAGTRKVKNFNGTRWGLETFDTGRNTYLWYQNTIGERRGETITWGKENPGGGTDSYKSSYVKKEKEEILSKEEHQGQKNR